MSNLSNFNTPRSKIPVRVDTSSCLASPIKTRSKSGPNFTPLTLSTAKKLQGSKLNLLKFNNSKTRTASCKQQTSPCEKIYPQAQKIIILGFAACIVISVITLLVPKFFLKI